MKPPLLLAVLSADAGFVVAAGVEAVVGVAVLEVDGDCPRNRLGTTYPRSLRVRPGAALLLHLSSSETGTSISSFDTPPDCEGGGDGPRGESIGWASTLSVSHALTSKLSKKGLRVKSHQHRESS